MESVSQWVVVVVDNRNPAVPDAEVYGPFDSHDRAKALAEGLRDRDDPEYPKRMYWTMVTRLHGSQGY